MKPNEGNLAPSISIYTPKLELPNHKTIQAIIIFIDNKKNSDNI